MHLKSNGLSRGLKVSKVAERTGSGNRSPVRKIFICFGCTASQLLGVCVLVLFIYLFGFWQ